ncbi:MAG: TRAP transporter small permease subunit, partial [Rhodospirillaceae bacterium]|nr:TRAP transporter small permease subunit [Rhodospirillaceae bacterium]
MAAALAPPAGRAAAGLYRLCGAVGAGFLVLIGLLILLEIGSRAAAVYVPGLKAYAGYSMAASAFFAFAYTFGHRAHIRMSAIVGRLAGRARRIAEIWCLAASSFVTGFVCWYAVKLVAVSWDLEDVSEGTDRMLLWIPQTAVAVGATVLFVCVLHRFVDVLRGADIGDQRSADVMATAE